MLLNRNLGLYIRCIAVVVLVLFTAACGGGTAGNAPPTLTVQAPLSDVDMQIGALLPVTYVDNDPDDDAVTDLYADADGDLATTFDRYPIATGRTDGDGTTQNVSWNTAGVPEGTYFIVARTTDGNNIVTDTCPGKVSIWKMWPRDHTNIILKDRFGNALTVASVEPYSPRQTCGSCHDVDEIANGYHFQQGRTDKDGAVQMKDDFFNDGRTWLLSDGMYGKW